MYAPVQQTWLFNLPWKMQTVINQALRAPDTHFCPNTKIVCRWMRSVVLRNADQEHTFMCSKDDLPSIEDLENELNYCSMHFVTHFLYGLEIIGYKHPESQIATIAWRYYKSFVEEICHFGLETEKQLDVRLADNAKVPEFLEEYSSLLFDKLKEPKYEEPERCPPRQYDNYLR